MTRAERVWYWFERHWWDLYEWALGQYYRLWSCKRGDHRLKMSGCMYCGAWPSEQMKIFITFR